MNYVINTFPQSQYSFRLYHNVKKKTWQKIRIQLAKPTKLETE